MMRKIIRLIFFTALIISFIIQTAHALDQQDIRPEGAAADYRRIDLYWDAPGTASTSAELVGKYEVYKDGQLFKQYEQEYKNQKHWQTLPRRHYYKS